MNERIEHIDSIRAIAILLMVMVHAAATWGPPPSTQPSFLVYVISGLGGLAAPLFVTVFGWGCFQSTANARQRTYRAGILLLAQCAINSSSPHLFDFWTPGILTLFAVLILTQPLWLKPIQTSKSFILMGMGSIFAFTLFLSDYQGSSVWNDRIVTENTFQWLNHVLFTGTYPLLPWIMFAMVGAWIASSSEKGTFPLTSKTRGVLLGALVSIGFSLGLALREGIEWASPSGDALLTFFPANAPFLVASLLGVTMIWLLIERVSVQHLGLLGRRSLTVYITHFIPIGALYSIDETYSFSFTTSMMVIIAYTLVWWPAVHAWDRLAPRMNVEQLFRAL